MDEEQQMDIVDTNQPQADSSITWSTSHENIQPQQNRKSSREMRQETTPLGSYQHGTVFLSSLRCREVGFEIAIYWYRVRGRRHNLKRMHLFAGELLHRILLACPADGVSLALMCTLLLIPDSFCADTKIIPDSARWISRRRNFANDSPKLGIEITMLYSSLA